MIVIADTSPFIGLLKIGCVDVLPKLYQTVIIPTQVAKELFDSHRPPIVQTFISKPPIWLSIKTPSSLESIPGIDEGELAAISLAQELSANLLLMDETRGREVALARNIPTVRTAAVLVEAANAGLINLKEAFDKIRATNFRVPVEALEALLKKHDDFMRNKDRGPILH